MIRPRLPEPIRFTRGRRAYLIVRDYTGSDGYVGLRDGQIVARAEAPQTVARTLIASF